MNEGDLVVPAPADFSMFDMLEGVEYPEDEVTVALNEKAAHQLAAVMAEIARYQVDHPTPDDRKQEARADPMRVMPQGEKLRFMRYMNAVTYSMFIQKLVRHSDGAVHAAPSADEIAAFMDKAPDAAKGKLVEKIQRLRVNSADYEANFDEGFFFFF